MTETYSFLDGDCKYYISMIFFCTLHQTFPQQNILDKYQYLKEKNGLISLICFSTGKFKYTV